jgi:adenylate cyclase class 2
MDQAGLRPKKMAIEFEKKYPLTDELYRAISDRLHDLGAKFEGEDEEENTIYNLEPLTGWAGVLRIRSIGSKTVLTFKRRIHSNSPIKQQIEHETEVSSRGAMENIIGELGLLPDVIYEKRRRTWSLRGAEIVLDTLPFGLYMEIEGSPQSISEAENLLGIAELPFEPRTYPNLTAELGRMNGATAEARFEK